LTQVTRSGPCASETLVRTGTCIKVPVSLLWQEEFFDGVLHILRPLKGLLLFRDSRQRFSDVGETGNESPVVRA
jgi:hypothetical protein